MRESVNKTAFQARMPLLLPAVFMGILSVAGVGTPLLGAEAESPSSAEGETQELRSITFRIYPQGIEESDGLFFYAEPDKPKPLRLFRSQRSLPYDYRGDAEFEILRRRPGPPEGPEWLYFPVARTKLPEDANEVLVFMTPGGGADGKEFSLGAIEAIREAIPTGFVGFYNATGAVLRGVLGPVMLNLRPGWNRPIPVDDFSDGDFLRIGLSVRMEGAERIVLHNQIRILPDRRTLIVLMPPREEGSTELFAFRIIEGGE